MLHGDLAPRAGPRFASSREPRGPGLRAPSGVARRAARAAVRGHARRCAGLSPTREQPAARVRSRHSRDASTRREFPLRIRCPTARGTPRLGRTNGSSHPRREARCARSQRASPRQLRRCAWYTRDRRPRSFALSFARYRLLRLRSVLRGFFERFRYMANGSIYPRSPRSARLGKQD